MLVLIRTDRHFSSRSNKSSRTRIAPRRQRRGATAMEYVVVLSFVFVAIFAAVQYLGSKLGRDYENTAQEVAPAQPGR
jgi:Flp pilus assembly pilin Flp